MMYFTCGSLPDGYSSQIGVITTPRRRGFQSIKDGAAWVGDNDAFNGKFSEDSFLEMLERLSPFRATCRFVVAPDVVADPVATAALFAVWGERIRAAGYPVAWVAQNGALPSGIPDCDAVFIGGSTEWKLSEAAHAICVAAKERGLWVHMGRVNSEKRVVTAALMGVDSVDGTFVAFQGTERGLRAISGWIATAAASRRQERLL